MSTYLYGDVTKKRLDAEPGTSTEAQPPGVSTYVDTFAALVPAEVLAAQAFITSLVVKRTSDDENAATVIAYPNVVVVSFIALAVISAALYLFGLGQRPSGLDYVRMIIPPLSFAGWTALQPNGFFDVVAPDFTGVPAQVTAVVLALVLGAGAHKLGSQADQQPPQQG
jgi:hypothetical protein